jgi:pilus assembly protein FimV
VRDLTKTIAVASLLVPASAQPLGIGDLKLHSALNQQLNAEINLVLSGGEKASEIKVQLAPPEKFDAAGVPWSYFLSKIKFDTVIRPNGTVIVKLSSNETLREPFLNFLLEVSWDQGNLYREFTVLIDPPAAYQQPIVPVIQPTQINQPQQVVQAVAKTRQPKASMLQAKITADSYGPTARNDTLWKIAEKVKPSADISTEQMMVALYESNPKAFYKDNVNALMAGHTLRVPDQQTVLNLSKAQAARIFREQTRIWRSPDKAVAKAKTEQQTEQSIADSNQLDLVAPTEEEVTNQVDVTPGQEQGGDEIAGTDADSVSGSAQQKSVDKTGDADAVLQTRLDKLEQQIAMMQKLLELKDEQLAALQNKEGSASTTQDQVIPDKTLVVSDQGQPKTEPSKSEPKKVSEVKPTPKPKPKPVPSVEPESSWFGEAYYTIVGGLGIVLLAGLGWLWWRKRTVEEETEADSMFAASSEIRMPDSEDVGSSGVVSFDETSNYDVGTVGESSFLSEFTPSDFDAFDTDQSEVDPISEADVYLAYGRYQQAEDLMRQAIEENPERNECKLKLLEIFYANENKEAFELYANELKDAGKQNDFAFWAKVVEMGNEIIPDSALLNVSKGSNIKADFPNDDKKSAFIAEKDEVTSKPLFTDEVDQNDSDPIEDLEDEFSLNLGDDESSNDALDFDLSSFADSEPEHKKTPEMPSADETGEFESVEFDLNTTGEEVSTTASKAEETDIQNELETFDFDFNTAEDENAAVDTEQDQTKQVGSVDVDDNLESFDFSDLKTGQDNKAEDSANNDLDDAKLDDDFDFNFDFNEAISTGAIGEEADAGVADLTDMDEFETKIDLAKAYIDMGDADAAKSIAEEVLEKGSDEQKKTAQSIMDQLK